VEFPDGTYVLHGRQEGTGILQSHCRLGGGDGLIARRRSLLGEPNFATPTLDLLKFGVALRPISGYRLVPVRTRQALHLG
jgi:hypothetical protein